MHVCYLLNYDIVKFELLNLKIKIFCNFLSNPETPTIIVRNLWYYLIMSILYGSFVFQQQFVLIAVTILSSPSATNPHSYFFRSKCENSVSMCFHILSWQGRLRKIMSLIYRESHLCALVKLFLLVFVFRNTILHAYIQY